MKEGSWFCTWEMAFAVTFADIIYQYVVEEPVEVPVVVEEVVPVALVEVTVVPVPASSCIVIVIFVFAISKIWFRIGMRSFVAGCIVKSKVDPSKESGINDVIEIYPFEYVTVPAVFERRIFVAPER